jgi:hypothetical protein
MLWMVTSGGLVCPPASAVPDPPFRFQATPSWWSFGRIRGARTASDCHCVVKIAWDRCPCAADLRYVVANGDAVTGSFLAIVQERSVRKMASRTAIFITLQIRIEPVTIPGRWRARPSRFMSLRRVNWNLPRCCFDRGKIDLPDLAA